MGSEMKAFGDYKVFLGGRKNGRVVKGAQRWPLTKDQINKMYISPSIRNWSLDGVQFCYYSFNIR